MEEMEARRKGERAGRIHREMAEMQARIMSDGGIDDPEALQAEFLRQRRAMAEARAKARAAEMAAAPTLAPAAEQGVAPATDQGVAPAAEQGEAPAADQGDAPAADQGDAHEDGM